MEVFISHSFEDKAAYTSICAVLDGQSTPRWDPESDLHPGALLSRQLLDAIRACACCVFVATKASLKSEWCAAEIGAFWGTGRQILVWVAETGIGGEDLPPHLKGHYWTSDVGKVADRAKEEVKGAASGAELLAPGATVLSRGLIPEFPSQPRSRDGVWDIVSRIRHAAIDALRAENPDFDPDDRSVRANVFVPVLIRDPDPHRGYAYRLQMQRRWSVHMNRPAEWEIRLLPGEGGTGTVFYDQQQKLIRPRDRYLRDEHKDDPHPELHWIICTPVVGSDGSSLAVLNIDGLGQTPSDAALIAAQARIQESVGELATALDEFPKTAFGLVVNDPDEG